MELTKKYNAKRREIRNNTAEFRWQAGRVYINAEQYFDGVPESAWNFFIGGYQPAQKWL